MARFIDGPLAGEEFPNVELPVEIVVSPAGGMSLRNYLIGDVTYQARWGRLAEAEARYVLNDEGDYSVMSPSDADAPVVAPVGTTDPAAIDLDPETKPPPPEG